MPAQRIVEQLPPKDRRIPLAKVVFKSPTEVEGLDIQVKTILARGECNLSLDPKYRYPQPFFDPDFRTVQLGERHYPLEDILYFIRARAAK